MKEGYELVNDNIIQENNETNLDLIKPTNENTQGKNSTKGRGRSKKPK